MRKAIAFRITSARICCHRVIMAEIEPVLDHLNYAVIHTENKRAFFRHASETARKMLGEEIEDWILNEIWINFITAEEEEEVNIPIPSLSAA